MGELPLGNRNQSGFTITELLVVIVLIGVLITMIFSLSGRTRDSAKVTQCMQHQRQIVVAIVHYATENSGQLPHVAPRWGADNDANPYWTTTLLPYAGQSAAPTGIRIGLNYLRCPAEKDPARFTYGLNYTEKHPRPVMTFSRQQLGFPGSGRLSTLGAKTMFVMDANNSVLYSPTQYPLNAGDRDSNATLLGAGIQYNQAAFDRHGGKVNASFADGSARVISIAEWREHQPGDW